jgi:hypothetical protein
MVDDAFWRLLTMSFDDWWLCFLRGLPCVLTICDHDVWWCLTMFLMIVDHMFDDCWQCVLTMFDHVCGWCLTMCFVDFDNVFTYMFPYKNIVVGYSTSSVTRHRRLLDIVGYSSSSVTRHRRLLNIVNLVHNRNKETNSENAGLPGLVRD